MFRVLFVVFVTLCAVGQTFCQANVKTATKSPPKGNGGVHGQGDTNEISGNGTGVYILDKKGDTVKILESAYDELNIFCHTGNFRLFVVGSRSVPVLI